MPIPAIVLALAEAATSAGAQLALRRLMTTVIPGLILGYGANDAINKTRAYVEGTENWNTRVPPQTGYYPLVPGATSPGENPIGPVFSPAWEIYPGPSPTCPTGSIAGFGTGVSAPSGCSDVIGEYNGLGDLQPVGLYYYARTYGPIIAHDEPVDGFFTAEAPYSWYRIFYSTYDADPVANHPSIPVGQPERALPISAAPYVPLVPRDWFPFDLVPTLIPDTIPLVGPARQPAGVPFSLQPKVPTITKPYTDTLPAPYLPEKFDRLPEDVVAIPTRPLKPYQVPAGPRTIVTPRGTVVVPSSSHNLLPPGRNVREAKVRARAVVKGWNAPWAVYSESIDAVKAVYYALPKQYRVRYKNTRFVKRKPHVNEMLAALWFHWDKVNYKLAAANFIVAQTQDAVIGYGAKQVAKGSLKLTGRDAFFTWATGPTF